MRHTDGTERAESPSFQQYAVGKRRTYSDAELVAQVLAGDKFAYDALLMRHAPVVLGFFSSRLSVPHNAEDLAQDVFLAAYAHLRSLREPERFVSWVMRIAHNHLASFLRSAARSMATQTTLDAVNGENPVDRVSDPAPTPVEQAAISQTRFVVLEEIAQLRDKYREIVSARLMREESTEEVARRLGLTPEAVRMRLLRGMQKLRKALQRRGVYSSDTLISGGKAGAKP